MDDFKEDLINACNTLKQGGVILYPTDTVWGIGCDATNVEAIGRIYDLKKRTDNKTMLVLVDSFDRLYSYVSEVSDVAYDLTELAEKPLTIIYEGARNLAKNIVGEDNSIGIRITKEVFSNQLCRQFRRPIVSTSANISGQPSPAFFKDISDEIKTGVDYIVKYRQNDNHPCKPSSIIRLNKNNTFRIIRR
jgi:L-threonylcarbamoyladenylate synthase